MSISIIIATSNRSQKLASVLPSYQNQKNIKEILIVDDCSADNTKEMIATFQAKDPRIKYFCNEERQGACKTKNVGLEKANGEYVFFGEDDVELSDNFIEIILDHLKQNKADIIGGRRIWPQYRESKKQAYKRADKKKNSPVFYDLLLVDCETNIKEDKEVYLLDASMFMTKKAAKTIKWDTSLFIDFVAWRSESDFQLTAAEKGFKLVFCPHVSGFHLPKDEVKMNLNNYIKYDWWVVRNNYFFTLKHKELLKEKLHINNLFLFNIRFIIDRVKKRYVGPFLETVKRRLKKD